MHELLSATAPWLLVTLTPVLLALLAPLAGERVRAGFAALLVLAAAVAVVAGVLEPDETRSLAIINAFMNPELGEPVPFVVDTVEAPRWQYPIVGAVLLLLPAAFLSLLRRRPPAAPCPVIYGSVLTVWTISARLALEKSAAPEGLTWAIGATMPLLVMLPFVGWWSGARNATWRKFVLMLLLLGLVQRSLIVAGSYFATTQGLGTHLDVGAIREVTLPLGHKSFSDPGDQTVAQWWTLMLIPQYILWVPFTIIAGLVLGGIPFVLARGRTR